MSLRLYLFDLHVTSNRKSKVEGLLSIKNLFQEVDWNRTKTERKPKLAGHLLLDGEAVWEDSKERSWSNMFTRFFFFPFIFTKPCKLLVCLLVGSNILSRGEFWDKGITSEIKITVLVFFTSELRSMSKLFGLFQVFFCSFPFF